jgi:hypothetical protein
MRQNLKFQVKNDRFELFNILSILNSYKKNKFYIFKFFLLFLRPREIYLIGEFFLIVSTKTNIGGNNKKNLNE